MIEEPAIRKAVQCLLTGPAEMVMCVEDLAVAYFAEMRTATDALNRIAEALIEQNAMVKAQHAERLAKLESVRPLGPARSPSHMPPAAPTVPIPVVRRPPQQRFGVEITENVKPYTVHEKDLNLAINTEQANDATGGSPVR